MVKPPSGCLPYNNLWVPFDTKIKLIIRSTLNFHWKLKKIYFPKINSWYFIGTKILAVWGKLSFFQNCKFPILQMSEGTDENPCTNMKNSLNPQKTRERERVRERERERRSTE